MVGWFVHISDVAGLNFITPPKNSWIHGSYAIIRVRLTLKTILIKFTQKTANHVKINKNLHAKNFLIPNKI